jgi:transcriptional regulator with XRE-family HTH domain
MDSRTELRDFLTSRRAKITPEQAGVPLHVYAGSRRVPGLRREEVAMLAGVSTDYYTRLERGNARGASDSVLDAVARALNLDEAERAHLFDLARAVGTPVRNRAASRGKNDVRPALQNLLDAMAMAPAYISNARLDVLAANRLGRAIYAPLFDGASRPPNIARFIYLDPAAADFYDDWDRTAHDAVAMLRTAAGRTPRDKALSALIGELATQSEPFRTRWAAHDVRRYCTGVKLLRHPVVGEIHLGFEAMDLPTDHDLTLFAYSAKPGTPDHDALELLASWAATHDQEQAAADAGRADH